MQTGTIDSLRGRYWRIFEWFIKNYAIPLFANVISVLFCWKVYGRLAVNPFQFVELHHSALWDLFICEVFP